MYSPIQAPSSPWIQVSLVACMFISIIIMYTTTTTTTTTTTINNNHDNDNSNDRSAWPTRPRRAGPPGPRTW